MRRRASASTPTCPGAGIWSNGGAVALQRQIQIEEADLAERAVLIDRERRNGTGSSGIEHVEKIAAYRDADRDETAWMAPVL